MLFCRRSGCRDRFAVYGHFSLAMGVVMQGLTLPILYYQREVPIEYYWVVLGWLITGSVLLFLDKKLPWWRFFLTLAAVFFMCAFLQRLAGSVPLPYHMR